MNNLITVSNGEQKVSARELHEMLGITKRFSQWFETNSQGFVEGEDFKGVYLKVQGNQYGGTQTVQDYECSTDMAKHICLMSRTEKGKEVRQYLIDLERAWNTPELVIARGLQASQKLIAEQTEKIKALGTELANKSLLIEQLEPKATYYDLILQCADLISTTEIAKDYGMSAKALNQKLHNFGIQFYQSGRWFLYAKYENKGYTQSKTTNFAKSNGTQGCSTHMYWTQKGRLFLYDFLKEHGVLPMIEREQQAV